MISTEVSTLYFCKEGIYIPDEVSLNIFGYLPPQALALACRVSKAWLSLASDDSLWKVFVKEYFPFYQNTEAASWKKIWEKLYVCNYIREEVSPYSDFTSFGRVIRYEAADEEGESNIYWNTSESFTKKGYFPLDSNYVVMDIEKGRAVASDYFTNNFHILSLEDQSVKTAVIDHEHDKAFIHGGLVISSKNSLPKPHVCLWDIDLMTPLYRLDVLGATLDHYLVQDDLLIVGMSSKRQGSTESESHIQIRNIKTKELIHILYGHKQKLFGFKLAEDLLVSTDIAPEGHHLECTLKLWNIKSGLCLLTIPLDKVSLRIGHRLFDFNGRFIVFTEGKVIKVWDASEKRELYSLTKHAADICALRLEGSLLFSGDENGVVHIWDVKRGYCIRRIEEKVEGAPEPIYKGIRWIHPEEDELVIFGTHLFQLRLKMD